MWQKEPVTIIATNSYCKPVTEASTAGRCRVLFSTQVEAIAEYRITRNPINVIAVKVDKIEQMKNVILDSGNDDQVILDRKANAFRPTPPNLILICRFK